MIVLDSDHCVALLRGTMDLRDHVGPDTPLAVTSISVAELAHGAQKSQRREENMARLDVLLAALSILAFDEVAALLVGALKADLERDGTPLADLDLQIAATALAHGAPLATHNRRHFARVSGLQLEDWIAA